MVFQMVKTTYLAFKATHATNRQERIDQIKVVGFFLVNNISFYC